MSAPQLAETGGEAAERAARLASMEAKIAALKDRDAPGSEFFDSSHVLRHVREWAYSLDINPFAALAVVLARLSADIPPWVVLPSLGGSAAGSLNLFVVLAGGSGMGKSDALSSHDQNFRPRPERNDPVVSFETATGEGVIQLYLTLEKIEGSKATVLTQTVRQAFADIDEIDALEAQAARGGANIMATLKTMWTGKAVGGATAATDRSRHLGAHKYRLALVAGCQYGAGNVLFNPQAIKTGITQRFVFADLRDPDLTEDAPESAAPPRLEFVPPAGMPFPTSIASTPTGKAVTFGHYVIGVDPAIHSEIRRNRRLQRMQTPGSLDGHWLFTALRVAALIAILHGHSQVTPEYWRKALQFMHHSDATRLKLMSALYAEVDRENESRGRGDAVRAAAADREAIRRTIVRLGDIVRAHAERGDHANAVGCTRRCFMLSLSAKAREHLDAALSEAVETGALLQDGSGKGSHYRAARIETDADRP